jgi:hypothetical protein
MLLLTGSTIAAGDFAALAAHFLDRTVVTYDPRTPRDHAALLSPSRIVLP